MTEVAAFTLADAARMLRDATKDKRYRALPLGIEVAQYLRYMKTQRDATPRTLRDYEYTLAKLALEHADLQLEDFEPPVGTERVEEFLHRWWEHSDPRTFTKNLSYVTSFFDWAVKKQKLYGNPARAIDRPRRRKKRVKTFQPSFVDLVLDGQPYAADRLGCELILIYALRRSEVAGVQLRDFDVERMQLLVRGKGRKERVIPILDPRFWNRLTLWQLEAGAGPESFLLYRKDTRRMRVPAGQGTERLTLPSGEVVDYAWVERRFHDRELRGNSVHRWWYGCLRRAGVIDGGVTRGWNMHRGRHTAITEFLRSDKADLKLAQLLAGHADISTTADTYDHRDELDLAKALAAYLKLDVEDLERVFGDDGEG